MPHFLSMVPHLFQFLLRATIGVVFESDLSFDQHISNVCRSSFYHIRQLRQIRPSLDLNSSIQLANALVSSKLDYCNSPFYGLPDTYIKRLQRVQNSLVRVIFPSLKRSDHITPALINFTGFQFIRESNLKLLPSLSRS